MIWENREAVFTGYGGFRGRSLLGEGGSGKAAGFAAGGKAFPLLLLLRDLPKVAGHAGGFLAGTKLDRGFFN
jgi:hypothetical protein